MIQRTDTVTIPRHELGCKPDPPAPQWHVVLLDDDDHSYDYVQKC